jgi:TPR repeat protein
LPSFRTSANISALALILVISACDRIPATYRSAKNEIKRAYWETEADEQDVQAAYNAAKHNCCGEDTLKDDLSALNLFCRAAKDGHKPAMVEVGKMYLNETTPADSIIPYDPAVAFTFFSMAEQYGYQHAVHHRESVGDQLTDQEFQRATRLIESFPVVPCEITR